MYWSRTGSLPELIFSLLLSLAWGGGGWLLVSAAFRLRTSERLVVGLAAGWTLFITLSNLLAQLLPHQAAFWTAGALILAGGLILALGQRGRPALWAGLRASLRAWPQLLALLALTYLFAMIGRGLALFDDYLHLPLVSVMAAGDIPPHFYLNPPASFAYHYGLQVYAASLVSVGGFFPWSAWDFSKALAIALTILLAWTWIRRVCGSRAAAFWGSLLVGFAGGARWLLLLVPSMLLLRLSNAVQLTNTGADTASNLITALSRPWPAEGSPPYPFPFAFHNGVFSPVIFALGSSGALPFAAVLLLLVLTRSRRISWTGVAVLTLILASLALSGEHLFVFLWAGIALAGVVYWIVRSRRGRPVPRQLLLAWAAVLLCSGLLSVLQGGFLTEAAKNLWAGLQASGAASQPDDELLKGTYNYFEFAPRWPPALFSAHLGQLSFLNPAQLVVLLAELGPALLLAPAACWLAARRLRRGDFLTAGLGLAAVLCFLVAAFFRYGVERSSTRLPATSLWIWVALGFPAAWFALRKAGQAGQVGLQAGYAVLAAGGLVIFAVQLAAISAPQLSSFITAGDASVAREYWDRLPGSAEVLDRIPYRAVALFGRPTRAYLDFYHPRPDWTRLVDYPDPAAFARAGYAYIYMDTDWWYEMEPEVRELFTQPCVQTLVHNKTTPEDERWLLDVQGCK